MIPRSEYPRPQFVRSDWLCLNGQWEFEIDSGDSGFERGLLNRPLTGKITVPFCPESSLSGIGHTDFMNAVWYRREATIPKEWLNKHILIHFQSVDYDATVWINGKEVARHRGGFTPFTCDLAGIANAGQTVTIVVRARDIFGEPRPVGKQSDRYGNFGCHYTRTTGIWQTVWMEPVNDVWLKRTRITPDVANGTLHLEQPLSANPAGYKIQAILKDGGEVIASAQCVAGSDFAPRLSLVIPESRRKLWEPGKPHLYDLELTLLDAAGKVADRVESYAALRSVSIEGKRVKINGKSVFQRLVLDQGYYPDGILTAPTDEALKRDIELSLAAGFNGARLHQKIFEERFLYHADKLGYLVWGEFPDWGCNNGPAGNNQQPGATYITQWLEELERDYSHPCIIGWCGLNETWQKHHDTITVLDDVTRGMFLAAKAMDTSRPVLDASGYSHRVPETDVWDSHYYLGKDWDQEFVKFTETLAGTADNHPHMNDGPNKETWSVPYRGQPYFLSEFGGLWWAANPDPNQPSWGYGDVPSDVQQLQNRIEALCKVLIDNKSVFGYCYTQLTDVYQEQNGIYTFDRRPKYQLDRLRQLQRSKAAIED